MPERADLTRRCCIVAGLALAWPGGARASLPGTATLLVPGPEEGAFARFADRLAGALARGATSAVVLRPDVLGGPDGVTAANRFATEAAPDGRTLLVLPAAAAQARLVGDPRARFDGTGWLAVCAVQAMAVVVGRDPRTLAGPARFGMAGPDSSAAAALLGLELLGIAAEPVTGLAGLRAEQALAQGAVDAILLQGPDVPARMAALQARAWFTLEAAGVRDPALPETPCLLDLPGSLPAGLRAAAQAASANARLQAALVLPALTPANLLALWRGAAQRWLDEEAKLGWGFGVRALSGADASPLLASLSPPAEAMLAYREWLLRRLNWRAD